MKKRIIISLSFLIYLTGFSQNFNYKVQGKYVHSIKKEKLNEARSMSDIIPYYPAQWIRAYVSLEIRATCNNKTLIAIHTNDTLSAEQKNILNTVDLGSDIAIKIKYKYDNPVINKIEDGTMYYSTTVVPEIEAEYVGGDQQMKQYLMDKTLSTISDTTTTKFNLGIVRFTVNEEGEISNAEVTRTSGDMKTDKLLIEVINKMPKWKPAQNSKGVKVKQEFEFSVRKNGRNGGGC